MFLQHDKALLIYFDQRNPSLQGKYYLVINNLASLKNSKQQIPLSRRYENNGYFGKYAYTDYFVCLELTNRISYDFSLDVSCNYADEFGTNLNYIPTYLGGDIHQTLAKFLLVYHSSLKKLILVKDDDISLFLTDLINRQDNYSDNFQQPSIQDNSNTTPWQSAQEVNQQLSHVFDQKLLNDESADEQMILNKSSMKSAGSNDLSTVNLVENNNLGDFLDYALAKSSQDLHLKLFLGQTIIKNFNSSSFKRLGYGTGMHLVEVPLNHPNLFFGKNLAQLCVEHDPLAKNASIEIVKDKITNCEKHLITVDLDYIKSVNDINQNTITTDLLTNNLFNDSKLFLPHHFADINNLIDLTIASMYQDSSSYWHLKNQAIIDRSDLKPKQKLFLDKVYPQDYLDLPVSQLLTPSFLSFTQQSFANYKHIFSDQLFLSQKIHQKFKTDEKAILLMNTSHLPIYQSPFYQNNLGLAKVIVSGKNLYSNLTDFNYLQFSLVLKYFMQEYVNLEQGFYLQNTAYMKDFQIYPTFATNTSYLENLAN